VKAVWISFGENLTNLNQRAYITFGSKFNVAAFVFEDADVTAADSNIALCTILCELNRKSKWRTANRKHLKLT